MEMGQPALGLFGLSVLLCYVAFRYQYSDCVRAVAYLSVSMERQVREGFGLQAQEAEIRQWAKAEGHRVVQWCRNKGVSGSNGLESRSGLFDALDATKRKSAVAIVFPSLDRHSHASDQRLIAGWFEGVDCA